MLTCFVLLKSDSCGQMYCRQLYVYRQISMKAYRKDGMRCAGREMPVTMHYKVCIQNDLNCQL